MRKKGDVMRRDGQKGVGGRRNDDAARSTSVAHEDGGGGEDTEARKKKSCNGGEKGKGQKMLSGTLNVKFPLDIIL